MSERAPVLVLEAARQQAGLSVLELWLAYFALGGMATVPEVEAILAGMERPGIRDHDLLALALNERFSEMDLDHPVQYSAEIGAE